MLSSEKIKVTLKEMMKTLPLAEINVTELCRRCGLHRQTFYYHYQDIYDLLDTIFLTEELKKLDKATDAKSAIQGLLDYVKHNFDFIIACYNSAARDLTEDFLFGKLNSKLFLLWNQPDSEVGLKRSQALKAARRVANFSAMEFGYCFRDPKINLEKFVRKINPIITSIVKHIIPAIIDMCRDE